MVSARQWGLPCPADPFQGSGVQGCRGQGWADTLPAGRGTLMSHTRCSLLSSSVSRAPSAETLLLLSQRFSVSTTVPAEPGFRPCTSLVSQAAPCGGPFTLWVKARFGIREGFTQQRSLHSGRLKGKGFSVCFVGPLAQYLCRRQHGRYLLDELTAFESDPGFLPDLRCHPRHSYVLRDS